MFDIGFWELSLIAVIALLILGPERLPRAARQAGMWAGKMKKMVSEVKSNINEELRMEELNALKQAGQDLKDNLQTTQKELGSVEQEMKRSAEEISSAAGSVDLASAINQSSPIAGESMASTADAAGSGKMQGAAPRTTPVAGAVKEAEKGAASGGKKDKSKKSKKATVGGKSGDKQKKPKKSGKKDGKAGA